ncbi:ABC transporter, partial [Actinomadura adrarensis]
MGGTGRLRRILPVGAWISVSVLALLLAAAVLAPWISPHDPLAQDLTRKLEGPSADHLLGTDRFG